MSVKLNLSRACSLELAQRQRSWLMDVTERHQLNPPSLSHLPPRTPPISHLAEPIFRWSPGPLVRFAQVRLLLVPPMSDDTDELAPGG